MNQPFKNGSYTRDFDGRPPTDVWPRFHMEVVPDVLASQRSGREIYRDEERVEFNLPGNPHHKPVFKVTDEHRQRWPKEYEAFQKGQETAVSGTPIDVLPFLKPSMVRELKALDIMTAEQLANLNDLGLQRIAMGGRRLKQLAEAYLDDEKALAMVRQAQAENDRKDAQIAALTLQVENLQTQMNQFFAAHMERANAPNPLLSVPPAMHDPVELMKMGRAMPELPVQSSFENLPEPPKRRRRATTQTDGDNDGKVEGGIA